MVSERKGRTRRLDLPVVEEWISAAEAAGLAGVSRQYMHNQADKFPSASRISGFLVFQREEIEKWVKDRDASLVTRQMSDNEQDITDTLDKLAAAM